MKQLITQQNPLITIKTTLLPPLISSTHNAKPKTHLKNPIISLKRGKKRSWSLKIPNKKLIFNAITTVASNLKILPEPFDTLVKDFLIVYGGGNGGKIGFKFGFGGDNGGKRNKGNKLGFWVILVISVGLTMWVVFEREKGVDLSGLWVLFGVAFVVGYYLWKKDVRNWVLGFCFGGLLMGLGFKNNEILGKLTDVLKVNFGNFGVDLKKGLRKWI